MLRFLTAGESHGPGLVATVEGLPAGLIVDTGDLAAELARRRLGFGRSPRMGLEKDQIEVLGGVRHGRTLGSPVAILIRNTEYEMKWSEEMNPTEGRPKRRMTTPRPGHADLPGMLKYDTHDARDILERASARETAARTVVGYLSKVLLGEIGIEVFSHIVEIGTVRVPDDFGAEISFESGSGGFDSDLPVTVRERDHGSFRGRLGDGSARMVVETGSGGFRLASSGGRSH